MIIIVIFRKVIQRKKEIEIQVLNYLIITKAFKEIIKTKYSLIKKLNNIKYKN